LKSIEYFENNDEKKMKCGNVLISFIQFNKQINYEKELIYLLIPFIETNELEYEVSHCFKVLFSKIKENFEGNKINLKIGKLNLLFRYTQKELHDYFMEEDVDITKIFFEWVKYLFSTVFPLPTLLQLWDHYFSKNDFELNSFICLAILEKFTNKLMELEQTEINILLLNLPEVEIYSIIKIAYNIQEYVKEINL
jgi:hypothetical protein